MTGQKPGLIVRLLVWLIEYYQKAGGSMRFFGLRCAFTPSCSHYCREALLLFGLRQGLRQGVRRIRRCRAGAGTKPIVDPVVPVMGRVDPPAK